MPPRTFTNPLTVRAAADPWMTFHDGFYYFTATLDPEGGLWVWRSRTLTGIDKGEKVKVWTAPRTGPQSRQIWAPELYFLQGRWYLYYTASDGTDANHRHYVLEAAGPNPLGRYVNKGRVDPALDKYAIDGSILELPDGRLFFLYTTGALHIAPMSSPTRVSGPATKIAQADLPWEHNWLEAPQTLIHNGSVFIVYSAGHSATINYRLGLLRLAPSRDPLDAAAWTKSPAPIFEPAGSVFTTGHCSFTKSPDGREDWLVYHAKDTAEYGFGGRTARAQPFTWHRDGSPHFGRPAQPGVPLPVPSGEV